MSATEMQNPVPIISSTSTTSTPPPIVNVPAPASKRECADGNCDHCLKGGMPLKKELLSFITILAVGIATVFFALWINEKRALAAVQKNIKTTPASVEQVAPKNEVTPGAPPMKAVSEMVALPEPKLNGTLSVEQALQQRRSRRTFADQPVTLSELGQVLWAAQGVTDKEHGYRTAPSGRSLYPFNTYVVIRNVEGITPGLYQYFPDKHQLGNLGLANAGDVLNEAGVQDNSQKAPVVIALAGVYGKVVEKYPNSYIEATMMEAGHIGQNIYLQVESLEMGTVVTGGFDAKKVGAALHLDPSEKVAYLVPFGHRAPEEPAKE